MGGIGVDRAVEDVGTLVEDLLGAVAMVGVEIDDGDAPVVAHEVLGSDRGVVEEARAPVGGAAGVVPRRSDRGEDEIGAACEEAGGGRGGVGRGLYGCPRAVEDDGDRVRAPLPDRGHDVLRRSVTAHGGQDVTGERPWHDGRRVAR